MLQSPGLSLVISGVSVLIIVLFLGQTVVGTRDTVQPASKSSSMPVAASASICFLVLGDMIFPCYATSVAVGPHMALLSAFMKKACSLSNSGS